jgi:epsilon-lactone hydrolase
MNTTPLQQVIDRVRGVYGSWRRDTGVTRMREDWEALFAPRDEIALSHFTLGGVDVAWVIASGAAASGAATPDADSARTLVYFHGGGFRVGSVRSHCELMWHLSRAAGCRVLGVDYRLAPEHAHPAPLHDALAVYRALLAGGVEAGDIALAGDSAGGNIVLNLLLQLRDTGEPMPARAVLMSAWTDLAATGESYQTRAGADPIHQQRMIQSMAAGYLGTGVSPEDPAVSPLYAPLHGLPPLLLQVGDAETVLDDSRLFAQRAQAAGGAATLSVYPHMIHVFQQFMHDLPEAREAIDEAGAFLRDGWH